MCIRDRALSDALEDSLKKTGVNIVFGQKVNSIIYSDVKKNWKVCTTSKLEKVIYYADDVIYTPPPQSLLKYLENPLHKDQNYIKRIQRLPDPSGAIVFYSALKKDHIKLLSSNHYQFVSTELGSLFVSISEEGDGRAPKGEITSVSYTHLTLPTTPYV